MSEQSNMTKSSKFSLYMSQKDYFSALHILYSVNHPSLLKIFPRLTENDINLELREIFNVGENEIELLLHYVKSYRIEVQKLIGVFSAFSTGVFFMLLGSIYLTAVVSPFFLFLIFLLSVILIGNCYQIYLVFVYLRWELLSPYYGFFEPHFEQ